MSKSIQQKLNRLMVDHAEAKGNMFDHFHCPIVHRDEATELCEGHIVNRALTGSSKRTVVQRADVDNFYGTLFESEFVKIRHRGRKAFDYLVDKDLSRDVKPEIQVDGMIVDHFIPRGPVPARYSDVVIEGPSGVANVALKMEPEELMRAAAETVAVEARVDLRLPALVSLLKSAHLTLFDMVGYRYAYSIGGLFLGRSILGKFFDQNSTLERSIIVANASGHFGQFANMVRPVVAGARGLRGTVDDHVVLVCTSPTGCMWALIVFVRTGNDLHAVVTPVIDTPSAVSYFASFLTRPTFRFQVQLAKHEGRKWHIMNDVKPVEWPESGFDWPSVASGGKRSR